MSDPDNYFNRMLRGETPRPPVLTLLGSRIEHHVSSCEDGTILMSFPRAGRICAAQILAELGLPGQSIVLEITEGLLLDAGSGINEQLLELRDAGVGVSLDDFGTGYSSMSYLQRYDIDYLKIDQSFVRNLGVSAKDLALVKAIIVMAHELGLKVIAEGVETAEQRALLQGLRCDELQGFLYAPGLAILCTALAFNSLGEALRKELDPTNKRL